MNKNDILIKLTSLSTAFDGLFISTENLIADIESSDKINADQYVELSDVYHLIQGAEKDTDELLVSIKNQIQ